MTSAFHPCTFSLSVFFFFSQPQLLTILTFQKYHIYVLSVDLAKIIFANLFLLLFMDITALFGIIHESHYTISVNFYLYLQYFREKVFNFKIGRAHV